MLKYNDQQVADLAMDFLHDGRPPVVREAVYVPPAVRPHADAAAKPRRRLHRRRLLRILGSLNVCSKEWVIRQYDHEVQGGSVVKPLVGAANDGPGDAAVLRPVLDSRRGIVVACGMNPRYGDFDPYWMAASAIDEAVRNCVAVGADPRPDRHPRQLLLGQHRPAGNARARWCAPPWPATTWPSRWARRSSAARTASTTNSAPRTPQSRSPFRRRC